MARNLEPRCKQCRRAGEKLLLKGDRCASVKCGAVRRNYPPGQHGQARKSRPTEYGTQLRQKQKVRKIYGLMERDFRHLIERANVLPGDVNQNIISLLERRLDNVVYRLGFATSRNQARQFVRHGHIRVNGRKCTVPSQLVSPNHEVAIERTNGTSATPFEEISKRWKQQKTPTWLVRSDSDFAGKVTSNPETDQLSQAYRIPLIVEFYSR
ncbi:MAG: 30S ribosomal protein S4 [Candidatus Kerfeldbacteria bacterium]|nr:30S ribosomal protein S4 [Candidatus Kerfeldbacteria bacterium]